MTESMQKQCNVSDNVNIYSIFSKLALPPKSDSKSTALSAELRARIMIILEDYPGSLKYLVLFVLSLRMQLSR